MKELVSKVVVLENHSRDGGVLAGPPTVLSALCRALGFKNACSDGRVYLTAPKIAALGLRSVNGQVPGWRQMSCDELAVAVEVAQHRAGKVA